MKLFKHYSFSLLFLFPLMMSAQINKPSLSPRIVIEQNVGLAGVKLDYGQPNAQGRKVFGGLIPYGTVWRTGANSSTKFSIDADVTLKGKEVPAGDYAIYTIPNEKEWTFILSKNTKLWGSAGYAAKDDLFRWQVPVTTLDDKLETLSIRFENFDANGGDLIIGWDYSKISLPFFVDLLSNSTISNFIISG